ncbi:hypothetical protein LTR50_003979 [Elasticomyces elasticus]|nr:hypothetical protein LTR50_003979 [Elasticomyces elasticus]
MAEMSSVDTSDADEREAQILRQVEYWLSDENLMTDSHLLGFCGISGTEPVPVSELLSFRKLRSLKPKVRTPHVTAAVQKSNFLQVVQGSDDQFYIRRTSPLAQIPEVKPEIIQTHKKMAKTNSQPHMTKGMLKPTGFEEYATEGPIRPEEYREELAIYDSSLPFTDRIETAVQRYVAKRKWHQENALIFNKYTMFCGFDSGRRDFTGGIAKQDLEDRTKDEIIQLTARHFLREDVKRDGTRFVVDFAGVAKGFLSSHLPHHTDIATERKVKVCTNVLKNFHNYLLLHDVCPEYASDIREVFGVCKQWEQEFLKTRTAESELPGDFNVVCSTLFDGNYNDVYTGDQAWNDVECTVGFSRKDARAILMAGIAAHGTQEQFEHAHLSNAAFETVFKFNDVGLEVTAIELADAETRTFYTSDLRNTFLRTLGKLHCKCWIYPAAADFDLPAHANRAKEGDPFEFWVEEEILQHCYVGMKLLANIRKLDVGIWFIDQLLGAFVSFFTWLPNETSKERKLAKFKYGDETKNDGGDESRDADAAMESMVGDIETANGADAV